MTVEEFLRNRNRQSISIAEQIEKMTTGIESASPSLAESLRKKAADLRIEANSNQGGGTKWK